jgi:hypothetical protein
MFRLALCGATLVCAVLAACSPDYVYLRPGTAEVDVRRDYVECTDQQQEQLSSGDPRDSEGPDSAASTTTCMERKGYRVRIVEPSSSFLKAGGMR